MRSQAAAGRHNVIYRIIIPSSFLILVLQIFLLKLYWSKTTTEIEKVESQNALQILPQPISRTESDLSKKSLSTSFDDISLRHMTLTIPTKSECTSLPLKLGSCDNSKKSVVFNVPRPTCTYALNSDDVVFGIWHSIATEARLVPMLKTWARKSVVVLLASKAGVKGTKLFKGAQQAGSIPLLLDTGIEEDDYFSTLGKAFIGLRKMFETYPDAKWFVVLGDDNYLLLPNYLNVLSAFDPEEPWALTRMVYREAFQCKVAGGAGIVTSVALTRELAPYLEPYFNEIYSRTGGNVIKAKQEDKFHDIAFQRMVEGRGFSFTHIESFLHEPPGFYFNSNSGLASSHLPPNPSVFHYVPGTYMHHLHSLTYEVCVCNGLESALEKVIVGVHSNERSLTDEAKKISNTWGKFLNFEMILVNSSAPSHPKVNSPSIQIGAQSNFSEDSNLKLDKDNALQFERLTHMLLNYPSKEWYLLVDVDSYVLSSNLAHRISSFEKNEPIIIVGMSNGELQLDSDEYLISKSLAEIIIATQELDNNFNYSTASIASEINPNFVLVDPTFTHLADESFSKNGEICSAPVLLNLRPDVSDLRPEVKKTELNSKLSVAKYLLSATQSHDGCSVYVEDATNSDSPS